MSVHPDQRLEGEMFPDCERPYEEVVLLDVGGQRGEAVRRHQTVVGYTGTSHLNGPIISQVLEYIFTKSPKI